MAKKKTASETLPQDDHMPEQEKNRIRSLVDAQKNYFKTGETKSIKHRKQALKSLYSVIKHPESEIYDALKADLGCQNSRHTPPSSDSSSTKSHTREST